MNAIKVILVTLLKATKTKLYEKANKHMRSGGKASLIDRHIQCEGSHGKRVCFLGRTRRMARTRITLR